MVHMGIPGMSYTYVPCGKVGQDRHIGFTCEWYTWESLGYPTHVPCGTVRQDRHMSGTHGNPWDILPMSHVGQ